MERKLLHARSPLFRCRCKAFAKNENASFLERLCVASKTALLMTEFPKLFPNYSLITTNFSCAKHGKSSAHRCVRMFNDNVRVMERRTCGWVNPLQQMSKLTKIRADINDRLRLSGQKPVNFHYVWCDPTPSPLSYMVLDCTTIDISSCRKALRNPDGTYEIQECIRYDVPRGAVIPNELIEKTRPRLVPKTAESVPTIDHGVCSVARQAQRHMKRKAYLAKLATVGEMNLEHVSKMMVPKPFDHRTMMTLPGIVFDSAPKRGVGRSPAKPIVRSRKRKAAYISQQPPPVRTKFRHVSWDLDAAVAEVKRIAASYTENVLSPQGINSQRTINLTYTA